MTFHSKVLRLIKSLRMYSMKRLLKRRSGGSHTDAPAAKPPLRVSPKRFMEYMRKDLINHKDLIKDRLTQLSGVIGRQTWG